MNLFSLVLAIGSAAAAPAQPDTAQTARTFLEAFATNPPATKALVTTDAMIAVGDIGGPYSEFLRDVHSEATWLASCRVASLQPKPLPADAELDNEDTPPWLKGGSLTLLEGTYACKDATGAESNVSVSIVMKGGRVAQFAIASMADKR